MKKETLTSFEVTLAYLLNAIEYGLPRNYILALDFESLHKGNYYIDLGEGCFL